MSHTEPDNVNFDTVRMMGLAMCICLSVLAVCAVIIFWVIA
jgi:hypothetical protein